MDLLGYITGLDIGYITGDLVGYISGFDIRYIRNMCSAFGVDNWLLSYRGMEYLATYRGGLFL